MTKVRSDEKGLYVITGGYVGRPKMRKKVVGSYLETFFNEGDVVKAHHFAGSQIIGVGTKDVSFKKHKGYEIWWTDGFSPKVKRIMEKYCKGNFELVYNGLKNI